ncbi:MAG: cytochrome C biogenesis protein [Verrucomicrobia bacterium]|nr:MAG: cytochrome C biogenesis protein [Verrucomicrobiota bacterium]
MMKSAIRPPGWDDLEAELNTFEQDIPGGVKAVLARDSGQPYDKVVFERFGAPLSELLELSKDPNAGQSFPLVVPPSNPSQNRDAWNSVAQAIVESVREGKIPAPVKYLAALGTAYSTGKTDAFNTAVADYKAWFEQNDFAPEVKKGRNEFFFNDTKAFLHSMIIYICAFILACLSLLFLSLVPLVGEIFRRSSFYIIALAFVVHTFGLGFRMYLEGRPPVTNLYSSAIFIGWGAVIFGLVLERVYKLGLGNVVASFAGFVTLLIAHNLAIGGDTMEMMRAVLDTNFWLATHVVVVTLGYASTFVAGFLAILYIFLGLLTPILRQKISARDASALAASAAPGGVPAAVVTAAVMKTQAGKIDVGQALSKMVYAILCFATLFSFTGTVLGGIWADQSWGRFWGWDPKENGALMIVLWNALVLHARWGGLVRERGIMNLAVFGNILTSFSWFGVNMLGVGLHSYGFMDAAFNWLMAFVGSQLVIIGLGLLPLNFWRSYRSAAVPPPIPGMSPEPQTT